MSQKWKCHKNGNLTEMEMSLNGNVTKMKMSLKQKCPLNRNVTKI